MTYELHIQCAKRLLERESKGLFPALSLSLFCKLMHVARLTGLKNALDPHNFLLPLLVDYQRCIVLEVVTHSIGEQCLYSGTKNISALRLIDIQYSHESTYGGLPLMQFASAIFVSLILMVMICTSTLPSLIIQDERVRPELKKLNVLLTGDVNRDPQNGENPNWDEHNHVLSFPTY